MNDPVAELVFVLLIIYLWSCVLWVRPNQVIVAWSPLAGWSFRTFRTLWGNDRGGLFLQNPIPIISAVVLSPFPLSISPAGICGRPPEGYAAGQHQATAQFVAFDEIAEAAVIGSALHINGSFLVQAASAEAAAELKHVIEHCKHFPLQRESVITDFVRHVLDFNLAQKEVLSIRQRMLKMQLFCWAVCIELFAVLPVVARTLGSDALFWCLAVVVLTNFVTVVVLYRTYARCCDANVPLTELATMVLCFPRTIRSFDILKAGLTRHFHPLVFAAAVDNILFRNMARIVLAELAYSAPHWNAVEQYFRSACHETLRVRLREIGIEPEELLAPPEQHDPGSISYCPLCRHQYLRLDGTCADCIGVPLQRFSPAYALLNAGAHGRDQTPQV